MEVAPHMLDMAFWKDFLANALATILGVVIGLPIALYIGRWTQRHADMSQAARTALETRARKLKVLGLIKGELSFNLGTLRGLTHTLAPLDSRKDNQMIAQAYLVQAQFTDEAWAAFSGAGETAYLDDPVLLDAISHAYFSIGRVKGLSDKLFTLNYVAGDSVATQLISGMEDVLQLSLEMAVQSIGDVIARIDLMKGA